MDQIITIISLSLITSIISFSVTKTDLFRGFRRWVMLNFSELADFIQCFYCLSFWIALVLVSIYQPKLIDSPIPVLDYFLSTFVIMSLSTFVGAGIIKALKEN